MANLEPLGIKRIDSLHYYVHDLDRSRRLYVDQLDFAEVGRSDATLTAQAKQQSVHFRAGDVNLVFFEPRGKGGRAARFLAKHPEGVGTVVFEVADAQRAFELLDARGATFITDVQRYEDEGGVLRTFSITTPYADTTFRFVERAGYRGHHPHYEALEPPAQSNKYGFSHIDHITSNFPTMQPFLLWMEHVMGFEAYWEVAFHTDDVAGPRDAGSGLKSVVMWDPHSGVKFANNEPMRPHFRQSQINVFLEDHRGAGIQHAALITRDIFETVRGLRGAGVRFMPTPDSYYEMLPDRLDRLGVGQIEEPIDLLRSLEVLVDGQAKGQYMLQIFLQEAAGLHLDREAGPFFIEIIQRKGDRGFGAGNFRALFESIERSQKAEGRS